MQELLKSLEEIAHRVKNSTELAPVKQSVDAARKNANAVKSKAQPALKATLEKLEAELGIWLTKLDVILKEPVGRQGMEKHARYWAEELRKVINVK